MINDLQRVEKMLDHAGKLFIVTLSKEGRTLHTEVLQGNQYLFFHFNSRGRLQKIEICDTGDKNMSLQQYLNLPVSEKLARLRKYILNHGWALHVATEKLEYFELQDNPEYIPSILIPIGTDWTDLPTRWWCALEDLSRVEKLPREEIYLKILNET